MIKEPWPAEGIREGSRIADYSWGYLHINEQGEPHFDTDTKPTRAEILARWGHYLEDNNIG